jgi:hypothetical protein
MALDAPRKLEFEQDELDCRGVLPRLAHQLVDRDRCRAEQVDQRPPFALARVHWRGSGGSIWSNADAQCQRTPRPRNRSCGAFG